MVLSPGMTTLAIVVAYLVFIIGVGEFARRVTSTQREDYFMASRSFGVLVLFFAILATNMSAFILVGVPGQAYRDGIATFGWGMGIYSLSLPLMFATAGYRLWLVGKKFGHITPGEIFNHRYDTTHLGTVVTLMMIVWTAPYVLIGAIGAGLSLNGLTQGLVPYWVGAGIILLVVFFYVYAGGMRGTGWTNVIQGVVFITVLWGLFIYLAIRLGGFSSATQQTLDVAPELAARDGSPNYLPKIWLSWAIIYAIDVVMGPHLFQRFLVGFNIRTMKWTVVLLPIGLLLTWVPPVLIGFWGVGQIPGMEGPAADSILPALVGSQFGPIFAGIVLAGILAAMMSTVDGQTLTISNLISTDVFRNYTDIGPEREVTYARAGVGIFLAIVFVLALVQPGTIVQIAELSFSGYALLFVPLIIGFYWRRATAAAAWVGVVWGFLGLWAFYFNVFPEAWTFGYLPIVPLLVVQIVLVAIVPYFTEQPPVERVQEYFDLFDGVW